ncbi:helix-turn-helix domain-containing protein [Pseudoalteromonas citrea]|uniref:helix-turn-helix domain-containing protein n=1 Tax=Pseudoalteromonas citrea TaxID=43655 RepID=UPI002016218D|nr:helix-turn-helix transcriptional regulator [Pseudoalteromonas citrea]
MINGEDLKAIRIRASITQQTMANRLDVDRKTIINYELGVSDIPSKKLFSWLRYCKLDTAVLLKQIKNIREDAKNSGKAKLLDFVTLAFIFSQLWNPDIVTQLYLFLLVVCTAYAVCTKNINMAHITGFILFTYSINYFIFQAGLINYITPETNKLLQGTIIYGTHLLFSLVLVLILIFRVQLSRLLSQSKNIELTHFDGLYHWIFIYTSTVYLLALLENVAWSYFEMKSWTLIYDNFEGLVYIAWAVSCGALLTMMICSSKNNRSDDVSTL